MNQKPDDQLPAELEALFQRRAADITTAPQISFPHLPAHDGGHLAHRRHRLSWLGVAAAAAVVVAAVGGTVIAIDGAKHGKPRLTAPATSGAPVVTPTPTPTVTSSCLIPMPGSWQTVIDRDALRVDQPVNEVLSRDGRTGELLLRQSTMSTGQGAAIFDHQELALFDRHGRGTTIYVVPDADKAKIIEVAPSGAFTERWIVFGLRGAQNLGGPTVLYAYDRQSRTLKEIAPQDAANATYSVPIVVGNTAWWLQGKWQDAQGVKVIGRDLVTGSDTAQIPSATGRALDVGTRLATVGKYSAIASWTGSGYTLSEAYPGNAFPASVVAAFEHATAFWIDGDLLTWRKQSDPSTEYSWLAGEDHPRNTALGGQESSTDSLEHRIIYRTGVTVELPDNLAYEGTVQGDYLISHHEGKLGPISLSRVSTADLPKLSCG